MKRFILDWWIGIVLLIIVSITYYNSRESQEEIKASIEKLEKSISDGKKKFNSAKFSSKLDIIYPELTATVYNAVPSQTNGDPSHTASMFKLDLSNPYKHRIIAVSRDLLGRFPYGTKVRVVGAGKYSGVYTVHDTMNKRWTKRIDILINKGMKLISKPNVQLKRM